MLRFDQLIRRDMVVRDVKRRHPETVAVFEQLGFRPVCDDCDILTGALRNGLNPAVVVDELNRATFGPQPETGEHASR